MYLRLLLNKLSISNMQEQIPQVFHYSPKANKFRQTFIKPLTFEEFMNVSEKRIAQQFQVLNSAELISNELICQKGKNMNRYMNILTYQHSRVKVSEIENYYVNASGIKSVVDGKEFTIFSQAPIPPFDNFWHAVYYKNVSLIIMLCMFEDPRRGKQAHLYWPQFNKTMKIKDPQMTITTTQEKTIEKDYQQRKFVIKGQDQTKQVSHYHWTGWSDMKAPTGSTLHILQDLIKITKKQVQQQKPMVIHCSAGVGRTGTLAAIVQGIRSLQKTKRISIFNIIENFRIHRYGCIQTHEQYHFIYSFLKYYFKNQS